MTIATQQMSSNTRRRISSRPPSTSLKASVRHNSAEVLSTLTSGLRISSPLSLPHNYNQAQKTAQSSASSLETPCHIKGKLCSASPLLILIRASARWRDPCAMYCTSCPSYLRLMRSDSALYISAAFALVVGPERARPSGTCALCVKLSSRGLLLNLHRF